MIRYGLDRNDRIHGPEEASAGVGRDFRSRSVGCLLGAGTRADKSTLIDGSQAAVSRASSGRQAKGRSALVCAVGDADAAFVSGL